MLSSYSAYSFAILSFQEYHLINLVFLTYCAMIWISFGQIFQYYRASYLSHINLYRLFLLFTLLLWPYSQMFKSILIIASHFHYCHSINDLPLSSSTLIHLCICSDSYHWHVFILICFGSYMCWSSFYHWRALIPIILIHMDALRQVFNVNKTSFSSVLTHIDFVLYFLSLIC